MTNDSFTALLHRIILIIYTFVINATSAVCHTGDCQECPVDLALVESQEGTTSPMFTVTCNQSSMYIQVFFLHRISSS